MFVHFGTNYYGKVDVVPNLCHVATRFVHINFVPLFPLESSIITAGANPGVAGQPVKTALSVKSVLAGWFRAILYVWVAVSVFAGLLVTAEHFEGHGAPLTPLLAVWGAAAGGGLVLWLSYRLSRANYDRAIQLGSQLGLEPGLVEQLMCGPDAGSPEPAPQPEGWERYS